MTKIEWAHHTYNPVIGCSECSPGCDSCYAEQMALRLATMPNAPKEYREIVDIGNRCWNGETAWVESAYQRLLKVPGKGKRVFVGSMTDLFHQSVPNSWVDRILMAVALQPQHTFLVLTKRPERLVAYFDWPYVRAQGITKAMMEMCGGIGPAEKHLSDKTGRTRPIWPLPNLWLGVTVCNWGELWKVDELWKAGAALHFVSYEPALEDISGELDLDGIDWVIAGAESGPRRRQADVSWFRKLKDQCVQASVPFFLKQMHSERGNVIHSPRLDGQQWLQFPEAK